MESFCLNSAKSYVGKRVNLHLKDGSVIISVNITKIVRDIEGGEKHRRETTALKLRGSQLVPLRKIAWAEPLLHMEGP